MSRPAWERPFLLYLLGVGVERQAADLAGVSYRRVTYFKQQCGAFRSAIARTLEIRQQRAEDAARKLAMRNTSPEQVAALERIIGAQEGNP